MGDMIDPRAETLAKEIQMIVAADRWKGRDLNAAPPEKWHRLRPETQQFWIDEASRILAALPPADDAVEALVKAVEKLGLRELVAGWNGENKDKPYAPHPPSLGATIKTTCGVVYEIDAAIRALGGDA